MKKPAKRPDPTNSRKNKKARDEALDREVLTFLVMVEEATEGDVVEAAVAKEHNVVLTEAKRKRGGSAGHAIRDRGITDNADDGHRGKIRRH